MPAEVTLTHKGVAGNPRLPGKVRCDWLLAGEWERWRLAVRAFRVSVGNDWMAQFDWLR